MHDSVRQQRAQSLLNQTRVHRNHRQIFGDTDLHVRSLSIRTRNRFAHEFGWIAPLAHRLEQDRIPSESRRADDRPCELDAGRPAAIRRNQVAAVAKPPTSRRAAFSTRAKQNRKAFSAISAIGGQFARLGFLPSARSLFTKSASCAAKASSNSRCSSVGGCGQPHGEHTFGAVTGHKRHMQCIRIGQRIGRFSGRLFLLKSPQSPRFRLCSTE